MNKTGFCLQWHITNRCDQRCKHCYIFSSGKQSPIIEWGISQATILLDDFLSFCETYQKVPFVAITGGDPLLHPQFWQIVELIKKRGIGLSMMGNPFHLTENVAKKLFVDYDVIDYQMSLDGLKETHDAIRKPGSFDSTISKLKEMIEWGYPTKVMTTVSKSNYAELPELTRLLVNIGVKMVHFARYCPTHGDTDQNIPPDEYRKLLENMWQVYDELNWSDTIFHLKDHLWQALLYEKGELKPKNDGIVYGGCHCGVSHMTILEDGTVYACRRMESPIGKVPDQSLSEIFFGKELGKYRQIEQIDGCKDCELLHYCRGCRAVAAGSTGNFLSKYPSCWRCR